MFLSVGGSCEMWNEVVQVKMCWAVHFPMTEDETRSRDDCHIKLRLPSVLFPYLPINYSYLPSQR